MKKKGILVLIVIIILVAIIFELIKLFNSDISIFNKVTEEDIFINIVQNEEKNEELKLNNDNQINYYYFKIVNNNLEDEKYNKVEVTPYIKLNFENEAEIIKYKLYSIESLEDSEEKWKEIVEKGESQTSFAEYYKCENLLPYEENADTNEQNYVIKIELDSESENFINLEEDMNQKFSIILGYREVK